MSFQGVNFSSEHYLSVSFDPELNETANAVIEEYRVHSADSSALSGIPNIR